MFSTKIMITTQGSDKNENWASRLKFSNFFLSLSAKYSNVESANRGSRGKSLKFNPPGPHAGGLNNSELTDHHWEIVTFCWAASMDSFIWKRKLWIDGSATSLVTWNEVFRCQILPHTSNSIDHWICPGIHNIQLWTLLKSTYSFDDGPIFLSIL